MNILEAKRELEATIRAYLQKDSEGVYCFSGVRQRPLLLMGPPGIGKTAIMEQIADTLGIGLVSYTMSHHTRQSAIGLPQIVEQSFDGETFSVTRYTMSEIIASVYDTMNKTGCREGILFLDEVNCVSDTLAPTMLQFLQNKTFGMHRLPEGWIIVAAGNPPEYNKSVRDFDVVTLDRVRTMNVEPNTEVFLQYGAERNLHGAVLAFLRLNPQRFYHVSRRGNKLFYVTARGWEDLSALLIGYEAVGQPVSEEVISEFLCLPETSREFYAYYMLYQKYGMDYAISDILSGSLSPVEYQFRCTLAAKADIVERFAVTQMLLQGMQSTCSRWERNEEKTTALHTALKTFLERGGSFADYVNQYREMVETKQRYGLMKPAELRVQNTILRELEELLLEMKQQRTLDSKEAICDFFQKANAERKEILEQVQTALGSGIRFLRSSMGDGQELTALLSGMTSSAGIMHFVAQNGCPEYLAVCEKLQVRLGEEELRKQCAQMTR